MSDLNRLLELADRAIAVMARGGDEWAFVASERYRSATADVQEFIYACDPSTIKGFLVTHKRLIERVKLAESRVKEAERNQEWARVTNEALQKAEARLRAAEEALTDIASWDQEKGHEGDHPGPCMGCQRVDIVRKTLARAKE